MRVSQADGNLNPPEVTFESSLIPGVVPATTRATPLSIQCGRTTFSSGSVSLDFLRIGVRDVDSSTAGRTQQCPFEPQSITWIATAADLPRGISVGNITYPVTGPNTGLAFVDVRWRPQCEDLSQVRPCFLFLCCYSSSQNTSQKHGLSLGCISANAAVHFLYMHLGLHLTHSCMLSLSLSCSHLLFCVQSVSGSRRPLEPARWCNCRTHEYPGTV